MYCLLIKNVKTEVFNYMTQNWTPNKYNRYKITTGEGISQIHVANSALDARIDFEKSMPNTKIVRIQLV